MNLTDYKKVFLLDIVEWERAKKNKIYKQGSIIIQVSATKGQIKYLEYDQLVESKYMVISSKNVDNKYLYYILANELPNFLKKYQTDINIQPEIFKYLELKIHTNIKTQKHIAEIFTKLDEDIKKEEEMLKEWEDFKKYHLNKMLIT